MTQKCSSCKNNKPLEEFPLTKKGNKAKNCLHCQEIKKIYISTHKEEIAKKQKEDYQKNKIYILEKAKKNYYNNNEIYKEKNKNSYEKNKVKRLEYKKEYYKKNKKEMLLDQKIDRKSNPEKYLLKAARKRAKEKNLPFNIGIEDIIIPNICPIFELPLEVGSISDRDNSPSLDKIIPELGYVKGNVKVISFKANTLKRDGHIEDFKKIISYIQESMNK